jgi:SAM-dependent methyltransferase
MNPIIGRIMSRPTTYNLVQRLAGTERINSEAASFAAKATEHKLAGLIVDVGSGTGIGRDIWPESWSYICMDPDARKVSRPDANHIHVIANGTDLPVGNGRADVVIMRLVAHHLDDRQFEQGLREANRILRKKGTLFFIDPVWVPDRFLSRLLWRYDLGRHPRTVDTLLTAIEGSFRVVACHMFTTLHRFLLVTATPVTGSVPSGTRPLRRELI